MKKYTHKSNKANLYKTVTLDKSLWEDDLTRNTSIMDQDCYTGWVFIITVAELGP